MLYVILKHAHAGIRWIAIIAILIALFNSIIKYRRSYNAHDKRINLLTIIILHTQVLLGLILYFVSPKVVFSAESMSNRMLRFFLVEHLIIMILAVVISTIGYSISKRAGLDSKKHMRISIFYGIALILILLAIPWPWQNYAASWF